VPYLNDVLHGKREPGMKILKHFGIRKAVQRTVTYTSTTEGA
jgi:hypothetical protein